MADYPAAAPTDRDAYWLSHLRACGSGSMKDYAAEHELDVRALYDAKARLKRKGVLADGAGSSVRLLRLAPPERSTEAPTRCRIELPNGVSVELACAPGELAGLLAAAAALR